MTWNDRIRRWPTLDTNPETPRQQQTDEADHLDDMLEDSFPASDPPSFTPVTALGPPICPPDCP